MSSRCVIVAFFFVLFSSFLFADTAASSTSDSTTPQPVPYGPAEFPQWQKDLRRGEILSFGALPFVTFFASIYYDIYRYYSHDQESGYLPWPFKNSSTAVALSENEQKKIILYSAGISIGVALVDFGYRTFAREIRMRKAERENGDQSNPIQIEPIADDKAAPDGDSN